MSDDTTIPSTTEVSVQRLELARTTVSVQRLELARTTQPP